MKLLITGGSGFLGRRAAACFGTLGLQVLSPSHGELDITDEASVRSWFREHQPEAASPQSSNNFICRILLLNFPSFVRLTWI